MITASVMSGKDVPGEMVCGPSPGMLKWMRSGPPELGVELAALIASRSVHPLALHVPSPGSKVLLTVKVVAAWAGLAARSMPIEAATKRARRKKARVLAPSTHMALCSAIFGML